MYISYYMGMCITFANVLHVKLCSHIGSGRGRACIQHTEILVLFLTFSDDVSFGKMRILFMSQFSPL